MSKISRKGKKHEREGERETHGEVDKQVSGITFGGDPAVLTDGSCGFTLRNGSCCGGLGSIPLS